MTEIQTIELVGVTQRDLERFYGELPGDFATAFSLKYDGADLLGDESISNILLRASWDYQGFEQSLTMDFQELTADRLGDFLRAVPYRDVDFEPIVLMDFAEGELRVHLQSAVLRVGTQEQIDELWESGERIDPDSAHSTESSTAEQEENRP